MQKSPPAWLRPPGRRLYREVQRGYDLDGPHEFQRLVTACEALDRLVQAREILDREGLTFTDRFEQPKARPEVAIERDSRLALLRSLRELGLDAADLEAARPPKLKVWA